MWLRGPRPRTQVHKEGPQVSWVVLRWLNFCSRDMVVGTVIAGPSVWKRQKRKLGALDHLTLTHQRSLDAHTGLLKLSLRTPIAAPSC